MRAPLDHGTVGAEEVAPPHWLQSRSDGHMNLWCDSSNSLFFFVLILIWQPGLLLSSTISLKNLLMSSLATLSTGPTSNRTWDTNEQCKVKCEMQCSAMFLQCFCTLTTLPAKVSPTARLALLSTHCLLWIKQRWFGQGLHHHHHHNQGHRGWFFGCYHPHHHCPAQVCNIAVISTCKMQQRANGKVRN